MIKIENVEVFGWEAAIRGMRNPKNSWDKSDSHWCNEDCPHVMNGTEPGKECNNGEYEYCIGEADYKLMKTLANAGDDHGKFLRMINVTFDLLAPLYFYKEWDTYKIGTVANSTSTMHKIHAKEFTMDDFSHENLDTVTACMLRGVIGTLEANRKAFLALDGEEAKQAWWNMIQLLPSSYNQKRTIQLNYAVLKNMYRSRRFHKLNEWRDFCDFIRTLPYSELITGEEN